jgi:KUP system potassium uptake protein
MRNLRHNKILHERLVFLTVISSDIPNVPRAERIRVEMLGNNCYQVDLTYGFVDFTDVPADLVMCSEHGLNFDPMETSYFLARENVIATPGRNGAVAEGLYASMVRTHA